MSSVLVISPATAQEVPAVPETPNIVDPKGDANYLNDQGGACVGAPLPPSCTPFAGDNVLPASAGTVSDIQKVWLTSDADSVSAHILTTAKPPASTPLIFRVRVDPGTGSRCLWFQASFASSANGATNATAATLRDTCATALGTQDAELIVNDGPDGTGITTIKVPRGLYPTFTDGAVLAAPDAHSRNYIVAVTAPQIDNTKPGTDFTITSGGAAPAEEPQEEPNEEPPGKSDPPGKGKKKGCSKGKGEKKGSCPGKKPAKPAKPGKPEAPKGAACPAYVPGEQGAEAETTIVGADATEEKPIEVTIAAPAGVPEAAIERVFHNVQVDSDAAEAGLYARYEFPIYEDHDMYLRYADGTEAARAAGFNPAPIIPNNGVFWTDGTGAGGHSEQGAEVLDGIRSADCAGYTLDLAAYLSEGGDMTLKLWLGEPQNDPAAPGAARSSVYEFLMSF